MPDEPKRVPHAQDMILVKNIDVDCTEVQSDVVQTTRRIADPDDPTIKHTEYADHGHEIDHSRHFEVRWGGQPFRIRPGEVRKMPRFIADHFAKHLADHILGKRQIAEKRQGLISSVVERPKVLRQILLGVDSYYLELGDIDEGLAALEAVHEANQTSNPLDLNGTQFSSGRGKVQSGGSELNAGTVPAKAEGVLENTDTRTDDEKLLAAGVVPDSLEGFSREDLAREAVALGIKVNKNDNKAAIASKIKAF